MRADREKLQLAMARACMNTKHLACATQLPIQTVNGTLRERGVRPATLGLIAKALGVDVAEILKEEN